MVLISKLSVQLTTETGKKLLAIYFLVLKCPFPSASSKEQDIPKAKYCFPDESDPLVLSVT